MALDADTLLDRMQLKSQLMRWRTLAIAALALSALLAFSKLTGLAHVTSDHVARVEISDIITDDRKRDELFEELGSNNFVEAAIIYMDTPGGTALGGEELYLSIKSLSEKKPTVILMRTLCTSAGYMAALGGDHILAREGTITGSIGVIMQTFEATELAENMGIKPITVKSAPNKSAPNPLEPFSDSQRRVIKGVIDDFYRFFVELVIENRPLNEAEVISIADGRIFTGRQALQAQLIDGIGGEKEAMAWLNENHDIALDADIRDHKVKREIDTIFGQIEQKLSQVLFSFKNMLLRLDGMLLIWQPPLTQ